MAGAIWLAAKSDPPKIPNRIVFCIAKPSVVGKNNGGKAARAQGRDWG